MSYSGDAAEQVVRMSLETGEVAIKLAGSGAKEIAVLLYSILKDQKRTRGKVRMESMIRSGKELKVFAVKDEDLERFCKEAKQYGVLYCVLKDRDANDGITDIMVRAEDAGKINRIFERFKLSTVDMASIKEEIQQSREAKVDDATPERGAATPQEKDAFLDALFGPTDKSLIDNYILPLIGDVKLDDINARMMDNFYKRLKTVKAKGRPHNKPTDAYITPRTIREIHKLLRNAFNQAVKWELMAKNPVQNAILPKCEENVRDIWDAETLFKAIDLCEDDILKLALNLSFACSLRMGELLGLTWDCVEISPESISEGKAYVYVDKELQRVSREAMSQIEEQGIKFKFPAVFPCCATVLVLKVPKTKTSIRKVFLPSAVAEMLVERRKAVDEIKELLGDEYKDYNLVFASSSGTPIEGATINRLFDKLMADNGLPKVVFHSIRHTSTTYKLMLSGGDIKGVQGDTGHAQATMVTERYAHILDDNRRMNAVRFQKEFYTPAGAEEPKAPDPVDQLDTSGKQALLIKLLSESPEMMAMIKAMAQTVV